MFGAAPDRLYLVAFADATNVKVRDSQVANHPIYAGVRMIHPHDTRHTRGSLLAALDVHPRIAMRILRHSKMAVTMEVYTHVSSEATRKAPRGLGTYLGKQDPK